MLTSRKFSSPPTGVINKPDSNPPASREQRATSIPKIVDRVVAKEPIKTMETLNTELAVYMLKTRHQESPDIACVIAKEMLELIVEKRHETKNPCDRNDTSTIERTVQIYLIG